MLAGTLLGMLLASVNQTLAATALPAIVGELGGIEHYSWVFSAYVLAATLTIPLYGKLSDLYGRRPLFLAAIFLFSAGSVSPGSRRPSRCSSSGGRSRVSGQAGSSRSGLLSSATSSRRASAGNGRRSTATVFAFSAVGGPMIGGWIADNASWRLAFFVSLPLAALALTVVWFGFGAWGSRQRAADRLRRRCAPHARRRSRAGGRCLRRRRLRVELARDPRAARLHRQLLLAAFLPGNDAPRSRWFRSSSSATCYR